MSERTPDPVDRLAELLRDNPARLSDVQRARGAQGLVARLGLETPNTASSTAVVKRRRPMLWASIGVLAAASALFAVGLRHHRPEPPVAMPTPPETARERPPLAQPATVPADLALLRPADASDDDAGRARLETKGGEAIRAYLADCGRIVLRGSSELVVEENAAAAIALRLNRGTLLVSFDHDSGRALTVHTRDAVVRVTGTVFAVSASDGHTRVSVSRGSVEVAAGGLPVSVTAGKSWQVGAASLVTPESSIALAMRELRAWDASNATPPARPARSIAPAAIGPGAPTLTLPPVTVKQEAADDVPLPPSPTPGAQRTLEPNHAEGIYRDAEKALTTGNAAEAKRLLQDLVAKYPGDPLIAPATYELGRLAFAANDYRHARQQLRAVRDSAKPAARPFRDAAAFLLCRCEVDSGQREAARECLERFRASFPESPHHGTALALLAILHAEAKNCVLATPLIDEYLRGFPAGTHAQRLRELGRSCAPNQPSAP
jgi:TolA-binding protein